MKPFIPREWMRMRKQPHPTAILDHVDQFGTAVFTDGKCVYAPYSPGEVCWVRETWALVQIWTDEAGNADYIKEWTEKLPKELPKGWVAVYDAEWQEAHCLSRDDRFIKHWRSPVTMPRWAARRYVRILSCVPEQRGEWGWRVEWEEVRK